MSVDSLNKEFNDVIEVSFPRKNSLQKFFLSAHTKVLSVVMDSRESWFNGSRVVNERIIEYPQVFRWIREQGRVLDIGCTTSRLPMQLASLGYETHGVDIRPYPFQHRNLNFHQVDILKWKTELQFDIVLAISSLEHFGLGSYGISNQDTNLDQKAVAKIKTMMKPGGQLIVSVPFGQRGANTGYRVYDYDLLQSVFAGYRWIDSKFFHREEHDWIPGEMEEVQQISSVVAPVRGVAVLNLESLS
ncbi:MAG: DUF268 domain-containing protein [Chloroflexota bacterium]